MLKRIVAWIILAGFVLLLLNIAIFKFYWQLSLAVYIVIVIFFVLSSGKIIPSQEESRFGTGEGNSETDPNADDAGNDNGKANDRGDINRRDNGK